MNALKILFNPIFLLAAGLHAGLLMIPVAGGSSDELVPAPNPEGESITVTRIPPTQAKPVQSTAGQTAANTSKTSRPATTKPTATANKPTSGATKQQPRGQGNRQRQGNQSTVNRGTNDANQTNRNDNDNNRSDQTARNNSSPGLPPLPDNTNTTLERVPVTVTSEETTEQKAPTLVALRAGADTQAVPQLLKDFLTRLQYSLRETRDLATADAQQAWLAQLQEQQNIDLVDPQPLEKVLKISYPITIEDNGPRQIYSCLSPLPKIGLIGVVVDDNGEISTEPALLRSSGYPFLNDIALEKVQAYDAFPEANAQKIYTIPVEVDYDEETCVSLTKLGVPPVETTESREAPTMPPEGGRNFLEEDDSPSPFKKK